MSPDVSLQLSLEGADLLTAIESPPPTSAEVPPTTSSPSPESQETPGQTKQSEPDNVLVVPSPTTTSDAALQNQINPASGAGSSASSTNNSSTSVPLITVRVETTSGANISGQIRGADDRMAQDIRSAIQGVKPTEGAPTDLSPEALKVPLEAAARAIQAGGN